MIEGRKWFFDFYKNIKHLFSTFMIISDQLLLKLLLTLRTGLVLNQGAL